MSSSQRRVGPRAKRSGSKTPPAEADRGFYPVQVFTCGRCPGCGLVVGLDYPVPASGRPITCPLCARWPVPDAEDAAEVRGREGIH